MQVYLHKGMKNLLKGAWNIKVKKKWSTGQIVGLILGIIAAVIVLWIAFIISLFQLVDFFDKIDAGKNAGREYEKSYGDEELYNHDSQADSGKEVLPYENKEDEKDFDTEYYDFQHAIREDLDYQAVIETYQRDDFIKEEETGSISLYFEYPVITGDIPNLDGINRAIYEEINEIEAYIGEAAEFLSGQDAYDYVGTGYVTCMTDEFLSVAYVEYGYLNEEYLESYVISLNFDVQTGMILKNTDLVNINDDFSIDFRERCERQNGEIEELYYMSDQEITAYLTENDYLIAFYTPLGMEIGFNYYDGWVTVTYKDYKRHQKRL